MAGSSELLTLANVAGFKIVADCKNWCIYMYCESFIPSTSRNYKLINLDYVTVCSSCLICSNVLPKTNNVDLPQLLNSVVHV